MTDTNGPRDQGKMETRQGESRQAGRWARDEASQPYRTSQPGELDEDRAGEQRERVADRQGKAWLGARKGKATDLQGRSGQAGDRHDGAMESWGQRAILEERAKAGR